MSPRGERGIILELAIIHYLSGNKPMDMKLLSILTACILSFSCFAGIYCPDDLELGCDMDFTNTAMTGVATTAGQYSSFTPKYIDWVDNGHCGAGTIMRSWYVDINHNNEIDDYEPQCTQTITLTDIVSTIDVQFPDDIYLNCGDEVPSSSPTWTAGPCDLMAYSFDDVELTIGEGACTKIIREFTVINWCDYETGGADGLWEHSQFILFEDTEKPVLISCEDVELSTETCEGTFTISNSATDTGFCISESIRWDVHIDLWGDGTIDYVYGTAETGIFNIPATSNNEEVTITLPEQVKKGHHKVDWKINDGCGNVTSCKIGVHMLDTKAPTPFCHIIAYTALMEPTGTLEVAASSLVLKSTDNCTPDDQITYSFSADPADSLRQFDCSNFGFQFFQVHAIDSYGNADYCSVFMLIFDNLNSCNFRVDFAGRVADINGEGLADANLAFYNETDMMAEVLSDTDGIYAFSGLDLEQDMFLKPSFQGQTKEDITVADLVVLRRYILGQKEFNAIERELADLNGDGDVSAMDLLELRDYILDEDIHYPYAFASWIEQDTAYRMYESFPLEELVVEEEIYALQKGNLSANYVDNQWSVEAKPRQQRYLDYRIEDGKAMFSLDIDFDLQALQCGLNHARKAFNSSALEVSAGSVTGNDQEFKLMWHTDYAKDVEDAILFTVDLGASDFVNFTDKFSAYAYDAALNEYSLVLRDLTEAPRPLIYQKAGELIVEHVDGITVQILDLQGRLLSKIALREGFAKLSTATFTSGIYLVKIGNRTEKVFIK